MKTLKNIVSTVGLAGLAALAAAGCSGNKEDSSMFTFIKEGTFRGYPVSISMANGYKRRIVISNEKREPYIVAEAFGDRKLEEVKLRGYPQGSPIEKYDNPDSLEAAYQAVLDQNKGVK